MSEAVQKLLADLLAEAEAKSSTKVTKAIRLFSRVDDTYKVIVLHSLGGIPRPFSAHALRQMFDTCDLMDGLDSLIDDMEDELQAAAKREHPHDR